MRGRVLKPKTNKVSGYLSVQLNAPHGNSTRTVHTLVAEAFIGPRPAGLEVCHEDGVPANCDKDNLRYDTPKNNRADSIRHGTIARGGALPHAKLNDAAVLAIRIDGRLLRDIASEYGVSVSTVSRVRNGVDWHYVV